jgi:DMSO/TMAO reductase YedYZ molybdopterin-dependent catalytic subunit
MAERRKVVTTVPENSETPLDGVRSWVTPTRLFFVRNHFAVPTLDLATWRLTVEGRVKQRGHGKN